MLAEVVPIPNPMKVPVLVFNEVMLHMVHIVADAPPITYVCVATVDGRYLAAIWWYGDVEHSVVKICSSFLLAHPRMAVVMVSYSLLTGLVMQFIMVS